MALRRFTGSVIKFDRMRGWGFVKVDGLPHHEAAIHIMEFGQHVRVHDLGRGVRIEFYLENHAKGLRAIRANII